MSQNKQDTSVQDLAEKKDQGPLHFEFSGAVDEATLAEMMKAGVMYGHKKSRKNPRFNEYIFSVRSGMEVIDISRTIPAIEIVAQFLKKSKAEKKNILIIGTQPAAHEAVKKLSEALGNCPYVIRKWIGGLITNFSVLSKRLDYFKKQKKGMEEGAFGKYTKRERLLLEREIDKMSTKFTGLEDFTTVPDVMFIIDTSLRSHKSALHEAHVKGIPVVGIIDTDDNPNDFTYFIPANDHSRLSIEWVINRLISNLK